MNNRLTKYLFCLLLNCYLKFIFAIESRLALLDSDGKFKITWAVDEKSKIITFELNVKTTGYVGFGISKNGGMKDADIVIGGVSSDGSTYFKDRHGVGNILPEIDDKLDWTLLDSNESDGYTYLKFSRKLDTCDTQDIPITGDAQRFIWAIGEKDSLDYHGTERGSYVVNILDPPLSVDLSEYEVFSVTTQVQMPAKDTTYWCTMVQSPHFSQKQHAVAMGPHVINELAKRHTHHLAVARCTAPAGEDPDNFFEHFVSKGGTDCAKDGKARASPMFQYCMDIIYSWAMGGRVLYFPEDVGFPIAGNGREYYLLEVHLDNPQSLADIQFETGMHFYHTSQLRKVEAGLLNVGFASDWRMIIPPGSTNFKVAAHCGPTCTKDFNEEGYNMFNVQLHSHNSGKKMRLRQFRNGIELPWVADDQSYDNQFQENRNIPLRKLLAGDQLTLECVYDNTWVKPHATVGGYTTRDEMCDSMVYYYPKGDLTGCGSGALEKRILRLFGMESFSRNHGSKNAVVETPKEFERKGFIEHLDNKIEWTEELRKKLEHELTVGPQFGYCELEDVNLPSYTKPIEDKNLGNGTQINHRPKAPVVSYPRRIKKYEKVDDCKSKTESQQFLGRPQNEESVSRYSFKKIPEFPDFRR